VVEQVAHRPPHVADGGLVPLPADPLGLPLGGRGEQALLAPKRRITVCRETPARRATSSSGISSTGRCQNTATAASRIRSPVAAAAWARACIRYGRFGDTSIDFM
jgi:hypothetical protein